MTENMDSTSRVDTSRRDALLEMVARYEIYKEQQDRVDAAKEVRDNAREAYEAAMDQAAVTFTFIGAIDGDWHLVAIIQGNGRFQGVIKQIYGPQSIAIDHIPNEAEQLGAGGVIIDCSLVFALPGPAQPHSHTVAIDHTHGIVMPNISRDLLTGRAGFFKNRIFGMQYIF